MWAVNTEEICSRIRLWGRLPFKAKQPIKKFQITKDKYQINHNDQNSKSQT
jgi:hypothetical protein